MIEIDTDVEAELRGLEVLIDVLLDRDLKSFDRIQAEALDRLAGKLAEAGKTLRITHGRRPGTLGHAVHQQRGARR